MKTPTPFPHFGPSELHKEAGSGWDGVSHIAESQGPTAQIFSAITICIFSGYDAHAELGQFRSQKSGSVIHTHSAGNAHIKPIALIF